MISFISLFLTLPILEAKLTKPFNSSPHLYSIDFAFDQPKSLPKPGIGFKTIIHDITALIAGGGY